MHTGTLRIRMLVQSEEEDGKHETSLLEKNPQKHHCQHVHELYLCWGQTYGGDARNIHNFVINA